MEQLNDAPARGLLIGDIAALIGTSTSTLRFWEGQGVAEPEKDGRNQYRRYSPADACRFLFVRKYRSFGVRLARVPALMDADPVSRAAALSERLSAMDEELRRLGAARAALDRHLSELRAARDAVGRFLPGAVPETYFFGCVELGSVRMGVGSIAHECLGFLPAVDYAVVLDPGQSTGEKGFSCRWGFGVDAERFASLPGGLRGRAVRFPSRSCLFTALLRESPRDFTQAEFDALAAGVAARGAEIDGPILGHHLEIDTAGPAPRYLLSLFITIKE